MSGKAPITATITFLPGRELDVQLSGIDETIYPGKIARVEPLLQKAFRLFKSEYGNQILAERAAKNKASRTKLEKSIVTLHKEIDALSTSGKPEDLKKMQSRKKSLRNANEKLSQTAIA